MCYQEESVDDATKAEFAVRAWVETLAIEEALDAHDCSAERARFFVGREYIFTYDDLSHRPPISVAY